MTSPTNTVKLSYWERGTGLPVVLLHGFPFDHTLWQAQADALSREYRIITPDLRGHGQSPAPDGSYPMRDMAGDVVALLDSLGIEQVVWAGHSMGGYITLAALRDFGPRVRAAAFVATHPYADPPEKQQDRQNGARKALESGTESAVSGMIPTIFAPGADPESEQARRIRQIMFRTPPTGVAGVQQGMAARPDSVETLREARVPMVWIAGAQDQIVKRAMLEGLAQTLPSLRMVWIEGAGHLPMIEQPDATTEALRAFLGSMA